MKAVFRRKSLLFFFSLDPPFLTDGNLWNWEEITSQAGLDIPLVAGENFGAAVSFINDHFISLLVGAPGEPLGSQGGSVYALTAQPY